MKKFKVNKNENPVKLNNFKFYKSIKPCYRKTDTFILFLTLYYKYNTRNDGEIYQSYLPFQRIAIVHIVMLDDVFEFVAFVNTI